MKKQMLQGLRRLFMAISRGFATMAMCIEWASMTKQERKDRKNAIAFTTDKYI